MLKAFLTSIGMALRVMLLVTVGYAVVAFMNAPMFLGLVIVTASMVFGVKVAAVVAFFLTLIVSFGYLYRKAKAVVNGKTEKDNAINPAAATAESNA